MYRCFAFIIIFVLSLSAVDARGAQNPVIADSVTRQPLPSASIFNRHGSMIGLSSNKGKTPYLSPDSYPITVRYLGFKEKSVAFPTPDTIFLQKTVASLPEVVVESRQHKVLHMLAYVREYSTLSTYTDTVFLFREKMVDYMLVPDKKTKFKGWSNPRILSCRSYYHITNNQGLDSVSDISNHHFSWSDWIGVAPSVPLPSALLIADEATDTVRGKYSPTEIWTKHRDNLMVDVNVLADTSSRKWVPNLSGFFRNNLDFEQFRLRFNYSDVTGDRLSPLDLTGYSFNIESNGRGHAMFGFNHLNEQFFVSTYAEVYMLDKEYITLKEAKKWTSSKLNFNEIGIYEPQDLPPLQPAICQLVDRVNNLNRDKIRLDIPPDYRYVSPHKNNKNFAFGHRALAMLKQLTGITLIKSHKNMRHNWNEFKHDRIRKNSRAY